MNLPSHLMEEPHFISRAMPFPDLISIMELQIFQGDALIHISGVAAKIFVDQ
ncbi:hypothetical protein [Flavilitoribacter nigricans]|uniref:hypothetical protein n=1 Tax=Flavilitoribacter nigricans TaxID=70997 RepID=UPI001475BD15|nr:hypothetical protein [Flavilitoribacter nigricans]